MSEPRSDRWISTAWSVLLHGALIAVLAYGWTSFKKQHDPEPPLPAIDAVVIDSRSLAGIPAARTPPPPPKPEPEPEPEPETPPEPPKPTPEEIAQQQQVEREQEDQRLAEEKRVADEKRAEEQRVQDERAESERKAREEAERKAEEAKKRLEEQKLAEQKKRDEAKRKEEEREARLEAERQAELRKSLEQEERVMAARSSGAMASWVQQITARIQRAWIRPSSAREGIDCVLLVTQVPGGEVVSVRVAQCNGDQAVRESIEAAAYRASPLPPPPDPALFERNLEIRFRPVD